ncbi:MAG: sorting protein [Belnapia sp.]|nr:sorting protein [Belnapia sp.]
MSKLSTLALGLGLAITTAVTAIAAPFLQITVQQGAGVIQSATGTNPLVTNLTTPTFFVNVQTGIVDTAAPSIDLGSSILANGAGTLTVTLSVQGLTSLVDANKWLTQFSGNWSTPNTTVTLKTYIADNNGLVNTANNTLPGGAVLLSTLIGSATPFATLATSGTTNTTGTFSLIEVLTVTTSGAGAISLDGSITRVPEPMSIALFGAALLGMGGLARRSRKQG